MNPVFPAIEFRTDVAWRKHADMESAIFCYNITVSSTKVTEHNFQYPETRTKSLGLYSLTPSIIFALYFSISIHSLDVTHIRDN